MNQPEVRQALSESNRLIKEQWQSVTRFSENHDYDPRWDYEIKKPEKSMIVMTNGIVKIIKKSLLPHMGFRQNFSVFFVKRGEFGPHILGRFVNGTSSRPIIGLDIEAIYDAMDYQESNAARQIEATIVHELAHAYQETLGIENGEGYEEAAEEFARKWILNGIVDLKILYVPGMLGLKEQSIYEQQYLKGFETFTLKRGTTVYHGTDSEDFDERADELQTPFWVSDSPEVAKYFGTGYQGGNKPRILTYTMTDDVNLIVIRDSEDMNEIDELAGSSGDPRELADFVCSRLGYGGWIIPDNYPEGADIMLCHTDIQLQDVTPLTEARENRVTYLGEHKPYGSTNGYVADTDKEDDYKHWLRIHGSDPRVKEFIQSVKRIAILESVDVPKEYRGKGYGNKLMKNFANDAKAAGANAIIAATNKTEIQAEGFDLIDWYKKLGFKKIIETSIGPIMALNLA